MKTIEGIAIATVKLFEAVDLPPMMNLFRRVKFMCLAHENCLNVALAMPYTILMAIHQKFDSRRMDIIHET